MRTVFVLITAALMVATTAAARDADQERDPFFTDGPRAASAQAPVPESPGRRKAGWGRDPFSRPFTGAAAHPDNGARAREKKLTGIICGPHACLAIIGGEVLRKGGRIGDQRVAAVHEQSVVLVNGTGASEEIFLENFSIHR